MTYQRITEHMFKTATKYSSIVMSLNGHHQITKLKYKFLDKKIDIDTIMDIENRK